MASNTIEYLIKIRDEASDALKDLEKEAGGASEGLGKVDKGTQSMTASMVKAQVVIGAAKIAFQGLKAATVDFAAGAIQVGAQMEGFEVKLETLLGSADAASERIEQLFEIGSTTPFALEQLVEAEIRLEAFGVTGDRARTAVMDLGAFMGGDLVGAANAVGKAWVGGAGAADILRDKGVMAMVKLQAGIDPTKLSLEEFRKTLIDTLTDPDGKIAGGTEKLAATFDGLMSNLRDAWFGFQKDVGDAELFGTAKDTLKLTLGLLGDNAKVTQQWATIVGTGLSAGMLLFAEGLSKAGQGILLLFSSLQELVILAVKTSEEMNKFLPDFLAVGQGLPSMAAAEEALQLTIDTAAALSVFDKEVDKLQEDINRLGRTKIGVPDRPTGGDDDITWESEVSVEGGGGGDDKPVPDLTVKPTVTVTTEPSTAGDSWEIGMNSMAEERNEALKSIIANTESLLGGTIPGNTWWAAVINFLAVVGDQEYNLNWKELEKTLHDAFVGAIKLWFSLDELFTVIIDGIALGIRDAVQMFMDERNRWGEPDQAEQSKAINDFNAWFEKRTFQTGSKFIDRTGLAFLHRGEQVTPAGGATPSRGFGGGGSGGLVVNVNAPLGIGPGTAEQLVRELNAILGARGLNLSVA